ncbi:MAG TPA: hypothetical protein IAA54_09825 [Candidatus Gallacutalibacter pullicola]|uniref:Uncharacterized protein n=1 Tax=Candidatus Gallacutalibacter pullicola TaxID=2840830 RepID=A0A9D1J269_9FIRM|nr:hypothetical protein [Candidatus Gallacutalibacter pullicola]
MEMKLVPFDSDLWDIYTGAYGSVRTEVKILMGHKKTAPPSGEKLRRLSAQEKGDYQIAFDNLCENLWHQTSFYNALYLVMPYMVTLLEQKESEHDFDWQLAIISAMGICLASAPDWNEESRIEPGDLLESYRLSVKKLKEKTKVFLSSHLDQISRLESRKRGEFLTALMAILGDREAAFLLTLSAREGCPLLCGRCGFGCENGSLDNPEFRERITPAPEKPWDGKSFDDPLTWYSGVLHRVGADAEASRLAYYYGTFTCPECGEKKPVLDFMKAYHSFV